MASTATDNKEIHPLCAMFPDIEGDAYESFKRSIEESGQQVPVLLWNDMVIDGKNRQRALVELGKPVAYKEWRPTKSAATQAEQEAELWELIKTLNFDRRHMTESQLAIVAAKMSGKPVGRPKKEAEEESRDGKPILSRQQAAEMMGVSERVVHKAANVLKHGSPALIEAVKDGTLTVGDAEKVLDRPKREQTSAVKRVESGEASSVQQAVRQQDDPNSTIPTPWDKHVARCTTVCDEFIAKIQEYALEIETALNGHTGGFSPRKISNACAVVFEQYGDVKKLLKNCQGRYRRNPPKEKE